VLAAAPSVIDDGLNRSRFSIYAKQLWRRAPVPPTPQTQIDGIYRADSSGALLFHGPYWFLKRGRWRVKLHGRILGAVTFSLLERFGYAVSQFTLEAGQTEHVLILRRDLVHFECAAYAAASHRRSRPRSPRGLRTGAAIAGGRLQLAGADAGGVGCRACSQWSSVPRLYPAAAGSRSRCRRRRIFTLTPRVFLVARTKTAGRRSRASSPSIVHL